MYTYTVESIDRHGVILGTAIGPGRIGETGIPNSSNSQLLQHLRPWHDIAPARLRMPASPSPRLHLPQSVIGRRFTTSRWRTLAHPRHGILNEPWLPPSPGPLPTTYFSPSQPRREIEGLLGDPRKDNHKPPDERILKLGKSERRLHLYPSLEARNDGTGYDMNWELPKCSRAERLTRLSPRSSPNTLPSPPHHPVQHASTRDPRAEH